MTMMRIVKSENQVAAAGAASLRRALVARLATIHPLESEIASQLIEHIAQNLSQRYTSISLFMNNAPYFLLK